MKKVVSLLLVFAMCFSLVACGKEAEEKKEKSKKSSNSKTTTEASTKDPARKDLCEICLKKYVGEWFFIENADSDVKIDIVTITEDGILKNDSGDFKLKFSCDKNGHGSIYAEDSDGNYIYDLFDNFDGIFIRSYDPWEEKFYRSTSKYTVVEITEDNWQDYFSSDINETFDTEHELIVNNNEWGEYESGYIKHKLVLKNSEKYANDTTLTFEYSYELEDAYYTFDSANSTVSSYRFIKSYGEKHSETVSIYGDKWNEWNESDYSKVYVGVHYLSADDLTNGTCESPRTKNPEKILRMKGVLVIKND